MFLSARHTLLTARLFAVSLALGTLLGSVASAQTAPQLVPYTARLIAGSGTVAIAKGAACPVSGNTGNVSTDAYGDGCLATEVQLGNAGAGGPRYAVADKNGNIFLGDFVNGLVRRVDAQTGIITAVAGGATSSPGVGTVCGTGVSISSDGDGCPANLVKLGKPAGLAFDKAGNLYFSDNQYDNIRKIAADATGLITTTGTITHIAGGTTFGYHVNNSSTTGPVIAATAGLLNFPYGLAFDSNGNLYVADEGNNAIEVINMNATTQTIQGLSVPAGTIAKISGWGNLNTKKADGNECPDFTAAATGSRGGCYFGKWVDGTAAVTTYNDGVYSLALDSANNLVFGNEFNNNVGQITTANIISTIAGIQGTAAKNLKSRGAAGSFAIGSIFGVALDPLNNLYITDASSGAIWRVDAAGKVMYAIAGGATAGNVCAGATDTLGDGCPAGQATFGSSGTGNFASTTLPGPGIYGISADAYGDVFVGDTENFTIREVASGTQFGMVGVNQSVTDVLDIHFVAGDGPAASGAYTLTSGSGIFTLGTATCTTNTPDGTTDCLLPVIASPTAIGAFSGSLTVKSNSGSGGTSVFALSGIGVTSPFTRTTLTVANTSSNCTGAATYSTSAQLALTATVASTGPAAGTVTFYDGGTQIGTPQTVASGKATLNFTFANAGTHNLTAVYSGDGTYFKTSTSPVVSITTSSPTFTAAAVNDKSTNVYGGCPQGMIGQCVVPAGGTALYSFTLTQSVYAGTISFACSGLPAYTSCVFSPATITASGCSASSTVAVSILTQQPAPVKQAGFDGGRWTALTSLTSLFGIALAFFAGFRRRRAAMRFGQLWMLLALMLAASGIVACGKGGQSFTGTPLGTSTVTITATGSTGTMSSFTVPLTVQ